MHVVNRSGLGGREAQNRALLVNDLARRVLNWAADNPAPAQQIVGDIARENMPAIVGRVAVGVAVSSRTGPTGGALGAAALAGGGVRALNSVVSQLEANRIDSNSLSDRSLASIYAAGALGGNVGFNARTGEITVSGTNTPLGSRIERTHTETICNVRSNC
mgnify:CR=1 FL=1